MVKLLCNWGPMHRLEIPEDRSLFVQIVELSQLIGNVRRAIREVAFRLFPIGSHTPRGENLLLPGNCFLGELLSWKIDFAFKMNFLL